jgi:nucleoside-diphosphate-sugar epimerase
LKDIKGIEDALQAAYPDWSVRRAFTAQIIINHVQARACVELMEADPTKLVHRNSFNIASMSFTPEIIYAEIKKRLPDFTMDYDVDPVKKAIAESWPNSLDDTCAREEWGWKPEWDLSSMTDDMLEVIRKKNLK